MCRLAQTLGGATTRGCYHLHPKIWGTSMRKSHSSVSAAALCLCVSVAHGQIDLFGNIAATLDRQWRHGNPPWDSTRVYDIGWNVAPVAASFQYGSFGNPADSLIPVPNTSQSFSNTTTNPASFPYQATCQYTVQHRWIITDGMTGDLVGTFNSFPAIDSASPDSGSTHLRRMALTLPAMHGHVAEPPGEPVHEAPSTKGMVLVGAFAFEARFVRADD